VSMILPSARVRADQPFGCLLTRSERFGGSADLPRLASAELPHDVKGMPELSLAGRPRVSGAVPAAHVLVIPTSGWVGSGVDRLWQHVYSMNGHELDPRRRTSREPARLRDSGQPKPERSVRVALENPDTVFENR
jgi:hypothetical protein